MQFCKDGDPKYGGQCYPICDHCYYFLNGHDLGKRSIENGYCKLHKREQDLCSACDDYICFMSVKGFKKFKMYIRRKRRTWKYKIDRIIWKIKRKKK